MPSHTASTLNSLSLIQKHIYFIKLTQFTVTEENCQIKAILKEKPEETAVIFQETNPAPTCHFLHVYFLLFLSLPPGDEPL